TISQGSSPALSGQGVSKRRWRIVSIWVVLIVKRLSERAGSQPWAGGHNPFGIAFKGIPDLWVMISLPGRRGRGFFRHTRGGFGSLLQRCNIPVLHCLLFHAFLSP